MTWHRRSGELQRQIEDFNQEMDNQASLIGWENDEQISKILGIYLFQGLGEISDKQEHCR